MNPFEILGVAPTAGPDEIEAAYRAQLRAWHPDLHQVDGPEAVALAEDRTRQLNEAITWVRAGWRPSAGAAWGRPGGPSDEGAGGPRPPHEGARRPVPCTYCGTPFTRLADYEAHLAAAHQIRNLFEPRPRAGSGRFLRAVGSLRFLPLWLAALITLLLVWFLPLVLAPLPLSFLALVLWTQTSPLFRRRPPSARPPGSGPRR